MVISDGDEANHIDRPANKKGSRKFSRSDRKVKQLSIHKRENFEEVGSICDWLRSHGLEKDEAADHWTIEVADALSVPSAPFGFVKSRVVTRLHVRAWCGNTIAEPDNETRANSPKLQERQKCSSVHGGICFVG